MKLWFLAFIVAATMVNGEEPKPQSDAHRGKPNDTAQHPENSAGRTVIVVNQPAPQGQEDNHPSESPNYLHELLLPQNAPTIALVIVGLLGIGTAIWTVRVIARQTKAAEDAAEAALLNTKAFIHSQRPWISLKTALDGSLSYDEDGAHITLKIEVENVGQMPAMGVFILPAIYIDSVPGKLSPPAERTRMCDQIRKIRQIGQVIFPGQPAIHRLDISAPVSDVEAGCTAIFKDKAAEARAFAAKIIVVVGYGTALDKDASYYTAAIYDLHRTESGRGDEPFCLKMELTPLERLQLHLAPVSAIIAE